MTVNLKNSKDCFCHTTKRERLMAFLKRRKKTQSWAARPAAEVGSGRKQPRM